MITGAIIAIVAFYSGAFVGVRVVRWTVEDLERRLK